MKSINIIMVFVLLAVIISCSQGKKNQQKEDAHDHLEMNEGSEQDHDSDAEQTDEHDHGGHDHGSGHDNDAMKEGEAKAWSPSGNGEELIRSDFHFIAGAMDNIDPEVMASEAGDNILKLKADGKPVAFVFHQSYGNVGMAASVDVSVFDGSFKLIHHAKDLDNHEFVSINNGNMKLGRVVNGEEVIFDNGEFEAGDGWLNLRVSAAGTHYKGYIGNKTVTHGHGDKMDNGYVGIMLAGTGDVLIRSIETVPLEDE